MKQNIYAPSSTTYSDPGRSTSRTPGHQGSQQLSVPSQSSSSRPVSNHRDQSQPLVPNHDVALRTPKLKKRNRVWRPGRTDSQETLRRTEKPWTKRVGIRIWKFLKITLTVLITVLLLASAFLALVWTDAFKIQHFLAIRGSLGLPGTASLLK